MNERAPEKVAAPPRVRDPWVGALEKVKEPAINSIPDVLNLDELGGGQDRHDQKRLQPSRPASLSRSRPGPASTPRSGLLFRAVLSYTGSRLGLLSSRGASRGPRGRACLGGSLRRAFALGFMNAVYNYRVGSRPRRRCRRDRFGGRQRGRGRERAP